jgi:hypothetical protein
MAELGEMVSLQRNHLIELMLTEVSFVNCRSKTGDFRRTKKPKIFLDSASRPLNFLALNLLRQPRNRINRPPDGSEFVMSVCCVRFAIGVPSQFLANLGWHIGVRHSAGEAVSKRMK